MQKLFNRMYLSDLLLAVCVCICQIFTICLLQVQARFHVLSFSAHILCFIFKKGHDMKGFIAICALGTIFLLYKHCNHFDWTVLLWNKCTQHFELFCFIHLKWTNAITKWEWYVVVELIASYFFRCWGHFCFADWK